MMLEKMDLCMEKRENWNSHFIPQIKISFKWIIDLTVKAKTIKVLKELHQT